MQNPVDPSRQQNATESRLQPTDGRPPGTSSAATAQHTPMRTTAISSRPAFMPDNFSGRDREWEDWAEQFDMASDINGWNDAKKLKMMALLLVGRAREIYRGLSPAARTDYKSLREAMGRHLGPSEQVDWNRAQLHSRQRTQGESARDFCNTLRRLVEKAYPSVDFNTRDMLAKDQFIAKVGSGDVRVQLRSAKPGNLETAMDLASEFEQIKSLEKKETVAALKMFSAEGPPDGITPGAMFTELRKLQEEVCALRSLVNPSGMNVANHGGQQRVNPGGRGRGGRWRPEGEGPSRACWECGCTRHMRRDCPYVSGNASGWR